MTNTNNSLSADAISQLMYKNSPSDIQSHQNDLMETLGLLLEGSYVTSKPFTDCQGMLIEVACLLADPEISDKISEKYYKKNGGAILKRMIDCFDRLSNSNQIRKYLTWYNLKTWGGTDEDLENAAHAYVKELTINKK